MKGHVIIIVPVETTETYEAAHGNVGTLPWDFEHEFASYLDAKLPEISDSGHFLTSACEVWTLSAFVENGGRLTFDHSQDQTTFHNSQDDF